MADHGDMAGQLSPVQNPFLAIANMLQGSGRARPNQLDIQHLLASRQIDVQAQQAVMGHQHQLDEASADAAHQRQKDLVTHEAHVGTRAWRSAATSAQKVGTPSQIAVGGVNVSFFDPNGGAVAPAASPVSPHVAAAAATGGTPTRKQAAPPQRTPGQTRVRTTIPMPQFQAPGQPSATSPSVTPTFQAPGP